MTTEKEMLELAAKAMGIEVFFDDDGECYRIKRSGNRTFWNPRKDDGDALRMAVSLSITIQFDDISMLVEATHPDTSYGQFVTYGVNKLEATRLAVVLAAAEIGRSMK